MPDRLHATSGYSLVAFIAVVLVAVVVGPSDPSPATPEPGRSTVSSSASYVQANDPPAVKALTVEQPPMVVAVGAAPPTTQAPVEPSPTEQPVASPSGSVEQVIDFFIPGLRARVPASISSGPCPNTGNANPFPYALEGVAPHSVCVDAARRTSDAQFQFVSIHEFIHLATADMFYGHGEGVTGWPAPNDFDGWSALIGVPTTTLAHEQSAGEFVADCIAVLLVGPVFEYYFPVWGGGGSCLTHPVALATSQRILDSLLSGAAR